MALAYDYDNSEFISVLLLCGNLDVLKEVYGIYQLRILLFQQTSCSIEEEKIWKYDICDKQRRRQLRCDKV